MASRLGNKGTRRIILILFIFLGPPSSQIASAQTFSDVAADHWAFDFITTFASNKITSGCDPERYCPRDAVTRAQMAVFLVRSMRGSEYRPPPARGNVFLDVGANDFAADFIEQLYLDGITSGCGGNDYCPTDTVTRAQMAVFLLRAKYGASYLPPAATGVFSDVAIGSFADAWIEQLAAEGISSGCGNSQFCPNTPVTRAQMAVFLVRTFALERVFPTTLTIPEFLSTPAAGYSKLVPVVLVTHIPTTDGVTLDLAEANYSYRPPEWRNNSVTDLIAYIDTINIRKKFVLEEMSRFRGYKIPSNTPYLGYKVVAHYVFYEPIPLDSRANPYNPNQQMVNFRALMEKINAQDWVDNHSVSEFWFNNYFNEKFQFWESNMSSPTTGDISNSDQFAGDLPVYSRTYVVYGTNYHRTQAEAIHNHGHQIERMLDYIDRRASGSSDLFWGAFVGVPGFPGPAMIPGRCGWTHQPPNTTVDYGYADMTLVDVDCEDWRPDGTGAKKAVNAAYFDGLAYAWPDGNMNIPQRAETQFYIWWGQNMPGRQNGIPYNSTTMENWWRIIGDWDSTITEGVNLYK